MNNFGDSDVSFVFCYKIVLVVDYAIRSLSLLLIKGRKNFVQNERK